MAPPPEHDALRQAHWTGWRPTREGRLWLGIVVLLLTVGVVKNINLLTLLGYVLLAVIALASVVAGRRLRRLEARRVLPENLFAGGPARLEVRLHNTSSRPVRGVRVEDGGASHTAGWFFERLEGHARRAVEAEIVLPRRGWYDFAPLAATGSYPFGLWQRRVLVGPPARVLVLPRPGKVLRERLRHQLRGADPRGDRVMRHRWRHEAAQADFHGLRPFRPGDSPRWIHWRTSARRGELMVREFEDVPGDDLALVVDVPGDSGRLEAVVALAATRVWEWGQRRGDRLVLSVGGARPGLIDGVTGPEHTRATLECLALLEPAGLGAAPPALPTDRVPSTASVVVLAAEDDGLAAHLEAALARPVTVLTPEQLRLAGVYTPP
ncbi:MAG: DUF58 domain-containing protein [Gemmataceae bacterium]